MSRAFKETKTHEVTTDVVIFTIKDDKLKVLLVKRAHEPFKGKWAIPGGFIRISETIDAAAIRILKEKTNVQSECNGLRCFNHKRNLRRKRQGKL